MFFSVIIPTCNRNDLLSKCLDLLNPNIQNISHDHYEVIVSDDSKVNQAKNLINERFEWVKWIEGPKKGPAANRNNAAKQAKGDWLIFLDDDCLPQQEWLSSYIEAIKLKNALVLEGCTAADRPKMRFDEEAPINMSGNNLWSCNFAIKKDFFFDVGGFDETFPYAAMEDVDFCIRVKKRTRLVFIPRAVVIHPWRRVRLFESFNKHLKSHNHFAEKYNFRGDFSFRRDRTKIFLGYAFGSFRELASFSMKGWPYYLEKCMLNFCLIFI